MLRALAFLIMILATNPSPVHSGEDAGETGIREATDKIASVLLRNINSKRITPRIAVQPFSEKKFGLQQSVADQLYNHLMISFREKGGKDIQMIERKHLPEMLENYQQFHGDNLNDPIDKAKADYEIVCEKIPAAKGINLYCTLTHLKNMVSTSARALLTGKAIRPQSVDLETAYIEITNHLILFAGDAESLVGGGFVDQSSGRLSDLGNYIERGLTQKLTERIQKKLKEEEVDCEVDKALRGNCNQTKKKKKTYKLAGKIWKLSNNELVIDAELTFVNKVKTTKQVHVDWGSLPKKFQKPNAAGHQFFEATAEAVISRGFNKKAALRGARNLARARVIRQALGFDAPVVSVVRSGGDAVHVLKAFSHGITIDERLEPVNPGNPGNRVKIRVKAKVKPVSRGAAPNLSARLNKEVYFSREMMKIIISAESTCHIGLFAWSANSRIVRIYPNQFFTDIVIEKNGVLELPYKGIKLASVPLPGNFSDFESFIIIANSDPVNFEALAPLPGSNVKATIKNSIPVPDFLSELSNFDLNKTRIIFLPYQVLN